MAPPTAGSMPPMMPVESMIAGSDRKSLVASGADWVPYNCFDSRFLSVSSACMILASIRLMACSLPLFWASSSPEMAIVA